jgi:nifR3 family TIM-barrel protein
MAGITDMPFRRVMKRMGAGLVISEFVSCHAIVHGGPRIQKMLSFHNDERPVGIQIFGGDEDVLAEAAVRVEQLGVDFVDINLGCPVPKVVRKKGGSAWLCYPNDLAEMLHKVKNRLSVPLTIKIRTGWDAQQINVHDIVSKASAAGVAMISVHGRTRAQGYAGLADWTLIEDVAKTSATPICGNGDLISGPLAVARLKRHKLSSVMIGRGALKNPWIFAEANEALKTFEAVDEDTQEHWMESIFKHHRLPEYIDVPEGKSYYERKVRKFQPKPVHASADFVRIRADRDAGALINMHLGFLREVYPEERVKLNFRKFLAWYAAGYPGAHAFRKYIFNEPDFSLIERRALEFFDSVKQMGPQALDAFDSTPVLMDGHG